MRCALNVWEFDDAGGKVCAVVVFDDEFGVGCEIGILDEGEGDGAIERRRNGGGCDASGFFVVKCGIEFGVGFEWYGSFELDARKLFGDVSAPVYAGDDFLPDVTAFGERDGFRIARFEDDVGVVNVRAVTRDSGFDAKDFERVVSGGTRARVDEGVEKIGVNKIADLKFGMRNE